MTPPLVVLIQPPPAHILHKSSFSIPLGLAYLATAIRSSGCAIIVLDFAVAPLSRSELGAFMEDRRPALVGITSTVINYENGLRVAAFVKEHSPHLPVIFGGPHASFLVEQSLSIKAVDVVVISEGDETILELLEYYLGRGGIDSLARIRGIAFRRGDGIIRTPPRPLIQGLDSLGLPARDLFDVHNYTHPATILTGRGCPFLCSFCANTAMWQRRYRKRSVENIIEELIALQELLKPKLVSILDDTFAYDPPRIQAFCEELLTRRLGLRWACTARGTKLPLALLKKMREAGCTHVLLGVESGSDRVLRDIRKATTTAEIRETVRGILRADISPLLSFVIGFPTDTPSSLRQTFAFADELEGLSPASSHKQARVSSSFATFVPLPGTAIHSQLSAPQRNGLAEHWGRCNFLDPVVPTTTLSVVELREFVFAAENRSNHNEQSV